MDYRTYIKSEEWREKRNQRIKIGKRCYICEINEGLVVHHKTYERLGNEDMKDLIVLCIVCHNILHAVKNGSRKYKNLNFNSNMWKKLYQLL